MLIKITILYKFYQFKYILYFLFKNLKKYDR